MTNELDEIRRQYQRQQIAMILNPYAYQAPQAFEGSKSESYAQQRYQALRAADKALEAFDEINPTPTYDVQALKDQS